MMIRFTNAQNEDAGKISIHYERPPKFKIWHCRDKLLSIGNLQFIRAPSVWTISLIRTTKEIKLVIHLENERRGGWEISHICEYSYRNDWETYWGRHVTNIHFESDTASEFFRPGKNI